MTLFKKILILSLAVLAIGGATIGVIATLRSPLFLVKQVTLLNQPIHSPVDDATLLELASVPIGSINLFDVNLEAVEERIVTGAPGGWVKQVSLTKKFPSSLLIEVEYRKPVALWQGGGGNLSYIDKDGVIFGSVSLGFYPDLPIFSGFIGEDKFRIMDGLHFLEGWAIASISKITELSTLIWDSEKGFRVSLQYPIPKGKGRTTVDFGSESDEILADQFTRLERVFGYLSKNSIAARHIWADSGKKIVVKTAKGS